MASILIVTSDIKSADKIMNVADGLDIQSRVVNSIAGCKECLNVESFIALFIDSRFDQGVIVDLAGKAWSKSPYMMCGVFNFGGDIKNEWQIRFIGGEVFNGKGALTNIKSALRRLPLTSPQGKKKNICLVEDLDSPRFIISSYLEALSYGKVLGASGAHEAFNLLLAEPDSFFCVITDINMPEVSGIELIAKIRNTNETAHIPAIVLTSYGSMENLIECVKAGATGFLVKPPKKVALQTELEKAIRIIVNKQSPRICRPEDAHLLEHLLADISFR